MKVITVQLLVITFITGCSEDDEATPVNEKESITTLHLFLTESNTNDLVVASFADVDGPGGDAPLYTDLLLKPNTEYEAEIKVLDESKTPAEDVTLEIQRENKEHQFFYTPSRSNLTVAYNDADGNNLPVGIKTKITTGGDSSGRLKVTLKHQPGVKNNDITTGDTDIEVEFNVLVE